MSSAKKPVRRGRQKKQILDEEDLQKHQFYEKAIEEGRLKQDSNDIFDTAKLDKNYFARHQNKSSHHESQVLNFDDESQSNPYTVASLTKEETQTTQKSTNKKRDYRRKKKNQNIFDSEDQEKLQIQSEIKHQQNTNAKLLGQENQGESQITEQRTKIGAGEILQSQSIKKQQPEEDEDLYSQTPHKLNPKQKQEEESDIEDDFNQVIKQKEEESEEEEERTFVLHKEIEKVPKEERKEFYYRTLPAGHVAYGYFKRFSSGLSEIYQMCGEDHRPLLFCENQRGCIGANYYISTTKEMDKNNASYLGKLRGNAAGSVYYLYDDGVQPKNQMNRSDWRVSMAAIEYENNFMGMNGPRKIKVTTPSAKLLQDADTFKLSEEESLLNFEPPIVTRFRNKTPKWNERLRSYALNFGGRVKLASIKNFILIDNQFKIEDEDEAENIIVFGKIDENTFSVEYRHPLSLFQAFGIVMSEFDFKINCE